LCGFIGRHAHPQRRCLPAPKYIRGGFFLRHQCGQYAGQHIAAAALGQRWRGDGMDGHALAIEYHTAMAFQQHRCIILYVQGACSTG